MCQHKFDHISLEPPAPTLQYTLVIVVVEFFFSGVNEPVTLSLTRVTSYLQQRDKGKQSDGGSEGRDRKRNTTTSVLFTFLHAFMKLKADMRIVSALWVEEAWQATYRKIESEKTPFFFSANRQPRMVALLKSVN